MQTSMSTRYRPVGRYTKLLRNIRPLNTTTTRTDHRHLFHPSQLARARMLLRIAFVSPARTRRNPLSLHWTQIPSPVTSQFMLDEREGQFLMSLQMIAPPPSRPQPSAERGVLASPARTPSINVAR